MPEWWTYSLTDFLLFSPRTYYRLIERHNAAVWPAPVLTLAVGVTIAALLRRPASLGSRAVAGVLAALWAWVGWAFVYRRYATINWAAVYFALLFAAEALLLAGMAVRGEVRFGWRRGAPGLLAAALFGMSLMVYPLLAPALGRGWSRAEIFGVMPDPTAVATLGLLLATEGSPRWPLLVAPILWCGLSGATLWAMGSAEAWIVLVSAGLAIAMSLARGRRSP